MNVKIIGAGSIGNHLAQACRRMGWQVSVVDSDKKALVRMREDIYPTRYGQWDDKIELYHSDEEPKGQFDIIMIGTPPDARLELARKALVEKPRMLFLEKPLCAPGDPFDDFVYGAVIPVVVGYDHAVSPSVNFLLEKVRNGEVGEVLTIDVEFREHWEGIFKAHPWLSGPSDSYLGFSNRGGGASGEHSHALHLWLNIAKAANFGKVSHVLSAKDIISHSGACYDQVASFTIVTWSGRIGRVVQDVVTKPPRKWARVQGTKGSIEWICNVPGIGDIVSLFKEGKEVETEFPKRRPDDFFEETKHLEKILSGEIAVRQSPISLEFGDLVMKILRGDFRVWRS